MKIRRFAAQLCITLLMAILGGPVVAQDFPDKPIRLLVGVTSGSLDASARAIAKVAAKHIGRPLIVVNMPGGTMTIAFNELARTTADGYSLAVMPTTYKSIIAHMQKTPFDPKVLRVLLGYGQFETVMVVRGDSPFKRFEDLIAHGRNNPGAISWGHSGIGTGTHIMGILLFRNAGVPGSVDIPFKGSAEMFQAMLGGHLMVGMSTVSGVVPGIKTGRYRPLLVATPGRLRDLPDVPTLKELGQPDLSMLDTFLSISIHSDTPSARVTRLHDALRKTIEDPELDKIFQASGLNSGYYPPEAIERIISDAEKVSLPLLKELKLFVQ
jgi:tripartite-type tricarboxylate transporter receptor subunit TctC